MYHCKWIFNCLFKRGIKGTLRWNILEQHLVLVSSFLSSLSTFIICVFVTILSEVFIINLNIFKFFWCQSLIDKSYCIKGSTGSASNRRSLVRKRRSAFVHCRLMLTHTFCSLLWDVVCGLSFVFCRRFLLLGSRIFTPSRGWVLLQVNTTVSPPSLAHPSVPQVSAQPLHKLFVWPRTRQCRRSRPDPLAPWLLAFLQLPTTAVLFS